MSMVVRQKRTSSKERVPGIEILNERLRIPESVLFNEGVYIESGVGLSFGVDRRLSYLPGEYAEASQRFELSVRQFRYKAEVWVFLAHSLAQNYGQPESRYPSHRSRCPLPNHRSLRIATSRSGSAFCSCAWISIEPSKRTT